jgi:glucose-1-phosphate thymidylyltransferase
MIAVVTNASDEQQVAKFLEMTYPSKGYQVVVQESTKGVAAALRSARCVNGVSDMLVMLGDNFFYGKRFVSAARKLCKLGRDQAGCIAINKPDSAAESCVVSFSDNGKPMRLVEKPDAPLSPWIVTGLYSYPDSAFEIIDELKPSARGELEITDLNKHYLREGKLVVTKVELGSETQWLDMGTPDNLFRASMLRYATKKYDDK